MNGNRREEVTKENLIRLGEIHSRTSEGKGLRSAQRERKVSCIAVGELEGDD